LDLLRSSLQGGFILELQSLLLIVFLCLLSALIAVFITIKILPGFLKSVFRDTAKETLLEVTNDANASQDQYEQDISSLIKELDKSLVKAKTVWETNTSSISEGFDQLSRSYIRWEEALSNPGEQGALAEESLEVMLETAGLVKGVNFDTQITERNEEGVLRPDFYVYTPDNGVIVIDSKAPMKLYKEAIEAQTETEKKQKLHQHARNMLAHASSLGQRDYTQATGRRTPDVVIMYVPNIAIYLAACEQIPDLIQQAWRHKVTICPPEAVYPVLKNVMLSWQQKKLHENAENIQKQAEMIHSRLKTFHSHFSKIGTQLKSAVKAFNSGVKSWDARLMPSIRKIEEMGISDQGRELEEAQTIDDRPLSLETPVTKEDDG